ASLDALPLLALEHGDLELGELLGEGGMGQVFSARQRSLRRDIAVKVRRPEQLSPAAVLAFVREARVTGYLDHANIPPVHALGATETGAPVLAMQRVEGRTWASLLAARAPGEIGGGADLERQLGILIQVSNAVSFAHSRGVLHRDLKPENVMLGAFGQ